MTRRVRRNHTAAFKAKVALSERWSRFLRQFGSLAKVDRVDIYAANLSIMGSIA